MYAILRTVRVDGVRRVVAGRTECTLARSRAAHSVHGFGARREVSSVQQAVAMAGRRAVRDRYARVIATRTETGGRASGTRRL